MTFSQSQTKSGLQIYSGGLNKKRILVVGGGPGISSRPYREMLAPLKDCVFWDYRGTGNSPPAAAYSTESDFRDLLEVLAQVGEPCVVLGHSYGSILALKLAVEFPQLVSGLILVGGTLGFGEVVAGLVERKQKAMSAADFNELLGVYGAVQAGNLSAEIAVKFLKLEALTQLHKPSAEKVAAFSQLCEISLPVHFGNQDFVGLNYTASAGQVKCPALIICGRQDAIVPLEFSEKLSSALPNAKLISIDNCGHWPFFEQPREFFASLASELK